MNSSGGDGLTAQESGFVAAELGSAWHPQTYRDLLAPVQEPVTLANWQLPPHNAWAFQHMRELMPSQVIDGTDEPRDLPEAPTALLELPLPQGGTLATMLAETQTDGLLLMQHGTVLLEHYAPGMNRRRRHLVMSVSKSIVSTVAASLFADGLLDPQSPVQAYVPELAGCGYAGATVRDLLDMRTGIRFSETYLDPASEVRVMERSMGWAPRLENDPLGMYPYVLTIVGEQPHGGVFTYRSIDTDVLGWVCERAAGRRMADLISERVWKPIGAFHDAEITADPLGVGIHDGGISATLRDLGRFGLMIAEGGTVAGRQVVPTAWIETLLSPPPDVRQAFADSGSEPYLPGGWYRNQFWMVPGDAGPIVLALGIHGQMIFIEPATGVVAAKLSSWPLPQEPTKLTGTINLFREVGRQLVG